MFTLLDEGGLRIFFQLPSRHTATLTGLFIPLIPEPPSQAAVFRAFNRELLIAMRNYDQHIAAEFYRTDPVENPFTRGIKLNPIYKVIQVFAFSEPLLFPLFSALAGDGTLWFH